MPIIRVTIWHDKKSQSYDCTDFPGIGSDWITLYQNLKRTCIPALGITRIEYDVANSKSKKNTKCDDRPLGFRG